MIVALCTDLAVHELVTDFDVKIPQPFCIHNNSSRFIYNLHDKTFSSMILGKPKQLQLVREAYQFQNTWAFPTPGKPKPVFRETICTTSLHTCVHTLKKPPQHSLIKSGHKSYTAYTFNFPKFTFNLFLFVSKKYIQ